MSLMSDGTEPELEDLRKLPLDEFLAHGAELTDRAERVLEDVEQGLDDLRRETERLIRRT